MTVAEEITTTTHQWVKHTVTPVKVVSDPIDGGIYAITDPEDQMTAEEEAVFGCENCDAVLSPETSEMPCPGREENS